MLVSLYPAVVWVAPWVAPWAALRLVPAVADVVEAGVGVLFCLCVLLVVGCAVAFRFFDDPEEATELVAFAGAGAVECASFPVA